MQNIHWFPGHMAKARRQIEDALKRVDVVLELVDARLPSASANPMLQSIAKSKPRLVVMTRTDLADPRQTERWMAHFESFGLSAIGVDAKSGAGITRLVPALEALMAERRARDLKRGIRPRAIRTMVTGIPNVGKSSLINRIAGRAANKTGDRPGITQSQQWIRLGSVELLDTPGVLWPKLEDQEAARALAVSGAIKQEILDDLEICAYFITWCIRHYPERLVERYPGVSLSQVDATQGDVIGDVSENRDRSIQDARRMEMEASSWEVVEPILETIARARGMLRQGGVPDVERAAKLVIREVQTGALGRMTLEWPPERR